MMAMLNVVPLVFVANGQMVREWIKSTGLTIATVRNVQERIRRRNDRESYSKEQKACGISTGAR